MCSCVYSEFLNIFGFSLPIPVRYELAAWARVAALALGAAPAWLMAPNASADASSEARMTVGRRGSVLI